MGTRADFYGETMSIRNVRNFWIETSAEGVVKTQATGPRSKNGGFTTRIYAREDATSVQILEVQGYAITDTHLRLDIVNLRTKKTDRITVER